MFCDGFARIHFHPYIALGSDEPQFWSPTAFGI